MKFGSYLKAQRVAEWAEFYLNYEGLDEMIQALSEVENAGLNVDVGKSGYGERVTSLSLVPNPSTQAKFRGKDVTEGEFFTWLEKEMDKIDKFSSSKLLDIKNKIEGLLEEARKVVADNLTEEKRTEITDQAKELGDGFLQIEKFVNLNFMGFHKILKKHDKNLPATPCKQFYLTRLHQQRWVKEDYSQVLVNLSKVYSLLRGEQPMLTRAQSTIGDTQAANQVFWVRTEDISQVKHTVLQHLPSYEHTAKSSTGDSRLMSAVYFDNAQLELYHGRLDGSPLASEVRIRWFDTENPEGDVYVEQKEYIDDWKGDATSHKRFAIKRYNVMPFLKGEFTAEDRASELAAAHAEQGEIEKTKESVEEMSKLFDSKMLEPRLRTVCQRSAFGDFKQHGVRVHLDTGVSMHLTSPRTGPDCLSEGRWYRNEKYPVLPSESTYFPHAILEVRMSDEHKPEWIGELIAQGLLTKVDNFSAFVHGCAALLHEEVQGTPFWLEDVSLQASLTPARSKAKRITFEDEDLDDDEKSDTVGKLRPTSTSKTTGMYLMHQSGNGQSARLKGASSANGYGTIPTDEKEEQPIMTAKLQSSSWLSRLCEGILFSSSSNKYAKIPLKVEPKVFLANERILLSWLGMAVTLATIGLSLFSSTSRSDGALNQGELVAHIIALLLLFVSILFSGYAVMTFHWRGKHIHARDDEMHDETGPLLLGMTLAGALVAILGVNVFLLV
mmetsp:Transcript_22910/g.40579  ORF Transcript_22910/g.40579 Transcript_22910/m.40579 type:complete len:724 (-) Transcript_22910:141-2312(-)